MAAHFFFQRVLLSCSVSRAAPSHSWNWNCNDPVSDYLEWGRWIDFVEIVSLKNCLHLSSYYKEMGTAGRKNILVLLCVSCWSKASIESVQVCLLIEATAANLKESQRSCLCVCLCVYVDALCSQSVWGFTPLDRKWPIIDDPVCLFVILPARCWRNLCLVCSRTGWWHTKTCGLSANTSSSSPGISSARTHRHRSRHRLGSINHCVL